jgi:nucleotide-binding universal stress UspA family protein
VILDEAAAWRADLVALTAGDRTWLSRAVRSGAAASAFRTRGMSALLYTPSG